MPFLRAQQHPPRMDNEELLKRAKHQQSQRNNVQGIWEAIERLVMPYRGNFWSPDLPESGVEWRRDAKHFDSSGAGAHADLTASVHGAMTSPNMQWFLMRFRDRDLNKNKQATEWIQGVSEVLYYQLQESNFNTEINEFYQDWGGYGSSFLTLEEAQGPRNAWNGFDFASPPLQECFFEPDWKGQVCRFYRRLRWTPLEIITRMGTENTPKKILEMDRNNKTEEQTVWYCVFPRKPGAEEVAYGKKRSPSKRPWAFRYILEADATTIEEGGFYEQPAFVGRYLKANNSQWGYGPAHLVLSDIAQVDFFSEIQGEGAAKLADPPWLAEDRALVTDLNTGHGQLSVVRRIDGMKDIGVNFRPDSLDARIDRLQASIRQRFHVDAFKLPDPEMGPDTAYAWSLLYEQMSRLMGPTIGRLHNDILQPILGRGVRILAREGMIEPPPAVVTDKNAEFDLEYLGQMARAQRMDRVNAAERWVSIGAKMTAAGFPEAADVVDAEDIMRSAARDLGVSATSVRDKQKAKVAKDKREALQERMMNAEAAEKEARGRKADSEAAQAEGAQ